MRSNHARSRIAVLLNGRMTATALLMLAIAGSIHASERAVERSATHQKLSSELGAMSAGGRFLLRGEIDALPIDDEPLTGGRFRLAGGLSTCAANADDDETSENPAAQETPAIDDGLTRLGPTSFDRLVTLLGQWGMCAASRPCPADLDGDGIVGPADIHRLLAH